MLAMSSPMLDHLLRLMTEREASDLHLKPTRPPLIRVHGRLQPLGAEPLKPEEIGSMVSGILQPQQQRRLVARAGPAQHPGGGRELRDQRLGRFGAVEELADVRLAASQGVDGRHPLQRLAARQIKDHRVPRSGGHRVGGHHPRGNQRAAGREPALPYVGQVGDPGLELNNLLMQRGGFVLERRLLAHYPGVLRGGDWFPPRSTPG